VDFSTAGDEEFFDCSDSENGISDIENRSVQYLHVHVHLGTVAVNLMLRAALLHIRLTILD